jgi:hypothetical protein
MVSLEVCRGALRYRLQVWRTILLRTCGYILPPNPAHDEACCDSFEFKGPIWSRAPIARLSSAWAHDVLDILSLTSSLTSSKLASQTPGEHSAHTHVKGTGLPPEARNRVGALHVLHSTERICLTTIELWLCTLMSHVQQRKASSLSQRRAAISPHIAHRASIFLIP